MKELLLPLLMTLSGFACAQQEAALAAYLQRKAGLSVPAAKQFIERYAPLNGTQHPASRLIHMTHNYGANDGNFHFEDSSRFIYSNGRGGDLNSGRINYDTKHSYTSYGQVYEEVVSQVFNRNGRADTLSSVSRWDTAAFYNGYREVYRYNTVGKDSVRIWQGWRNSSWDNQRRTIINYNQAGNISGILEEYRRGQLSAWDSSIRTTNTYNSAGSLIDSLVAVRDHDSLQRPIWKQQSHDTYTYNSAGKPTGWTHEHRRLSYPEYDNMRWSYYYDKNNVLTAQVLESMDSYTDSVFSKWDSAVIAPLANAPTVPAITHYMMVDSSWRMAWRNSMLLSAAGNPRATLQESLSGTEWIDRYREFYYYNSYEQLVYYVTNTSVNSEWLVQQADRESSYTYEPYDRLNIASNALVCPSLVLWPVPANRKLTIGLDLEGPQELRGVISDAGGMVVRSWRDKAASGYYAKELATQELPIGTYFLTIEGDGGHHVSGRFTIVH